MLFCSNGKLLKFTLLITLEKRFGLLAGFHGFSKFLAKKSQAQSKWAGQVEKELGELSHLT